MKNLLDLKPSDILDTWDIDIVRRRVVDHFKDYTMHIPDDVGAETLSLLVVSNFMKVFRFSKTEATYEELYVAENTIYGTSEKNYGAYLLCSKSDYARVTMKINRQSGQYSFFIGLSTSIWKMYSASEDFIQCGFKTSASDTALKTWGNFLDKEGVFDNDLSEFQRVLTSIVDTCHLHKLF